MSTDFEEPGDITGVTHAKINEFPWIVRLGSTKKDIISIDYQGSIISPNYVITSGYCVHDKTKEKLFCVVGVNDLNKYSSGKEGMKLKVKDIIMHEEYREHATGILNNIALIKLAHPLNLGKCGVDAIKLPPEGSGYCGKTATVAGWGMNRITLQNGRLMKRKLRIHTKKKCRTFMKNKLYEKNSLLYVTMNSAPSCYGDTGGSLMVKNSKGNFELAGIVSFGPIANMCICENEKPCLAGCYYVNVGHYLDWIKQNTAGETYLWGESPFTWLINNL